MRYAHQISKMALVLGLLPVAAMAGETGTVYTQLGTNGLGIGYATSVSPNWAVRGQYNALPKQSFSGDVSDFGSGSSLTVDLDWNSVQLGGDWYPFGDGFRTTVGVVFNNSKIAVNGTGKINNKNATVNAEMKMSDSVAPYLGIGYGVKPKMDKGLGFNMDLGVMFQNPKGTLTATNTTATPSEIAQKQREFQEAADKLKYFPVLSFGISYSF